MKLIHNGRLEYLEELANKIREKVIEMLLEAGSGHTAVQSKVWTRYRVAL